MYFKNEVKIIITVTKLDTNDIEKMSLTGVLCEDNLTNLDKGSAFFHPSNLQMAVDSI
jgi:hypothetical protein